MRERSELLRAAWAERNVAKLRARRIARIAWRGGAEERLAWRRARRHLEKGAKAQVSLEVVHLVHNSLVRELRHEMAGGFARCTHRADERQPLRAIGMNGPNRPD